jgi:hypothetical protein
MHVAPKPVGASGAAQSWLGGAAVWVTAASDPTSPPDRVTITVAIGR